MTIVAFPIRSGTPPPVSWRVGDEQRKMRWNINGLLRNTLQFVKEYILIKEYTESGHTKSEQLKSARKVKFDLIMGRFHLRTAKANRWDIAAIIAGCSRLLFHLRTAKANRWDTAQSMLVIGAQNTVSPANCKS